MKEIGGYLELENYNGEEYYNKAIALNTARNCLAYLIEKRKISKIHLPYYLCNSVKEKCKKMGCNIEFYNINKAFLPELIEKKVNINRNEYIYIVNYYGLISNSDLQKLKKKFTNIIVDNVQAFFQKPIRGIDTIYSCRKFFGVPDGAYLCTDLKMDEMLPIDISMDRMKHILGRFEGEGQEFYKYFRENDESFKDAEVKQMSKITHNLLKNIDYKKVKNIRTNNFKTLNVELKEINKLKIKTNINGAYYYPLYINEGKMLREKLIEKKIYVPVFWPNINLKNEMEKEFIEDILPVPCDQRYDKNDMLYISKLIKEIREE